MSRQTVHQAPQRAEQRTSTPPQRQTYARPNPRPSARLSTPRAPYPPQWTKYIHSCINGRVKPVRFLGDSLKCLREFPSSARHDAGRQIDKVQHQKQPDDFKAMPSIGRGVEEIRIWDDAGAYRVIYTARLPDAVYVLHAFQKKTRSTSKRDVEIAKARFAELMRGEK